MTTTAAPEDTRHRVLAVAVELIAAQGFSATSTREVCERMGFSKAALWYHFKSKDELLAAVLAPVVNDLQSLLARTPLRPGARARRQVLADYVALVDAHSDLMRLIYDDPSVRRNPAMEDVRHAWPRLHALLSGTDQPDTAARARSRGALGAVHAVMLRGSPTDDPTSLPHIALTAACGALGVPGPRS